MTKVFLKDGTRALTYEDVINDLNGKKYYSNYVYVRNNEPYEIFLSIIHSLLYDYPVELLDGNFSEKELEALKIDKSEIFAKHKISQPIKIQSFDSVFKRIAAVKAWRLSLYTSGTTGTPKKVTHTFQQLTKNVKQDERFKEDSWAFAYNPTHMAGLQVFFQALLNKNTIIYLFDKPFNEINQLLAEFNVTSISATATFYRNLVPYLKKSTFPNVKQITFGGEKYDSSLEAIIQASFPKARIRNIYATTEAGSLFTAEGDSFSISEKNKKYIKLNEDNELLIHRHLIGESEAHTFKGDWFNTGDVVELIDENKFTFVSRQSDIIHIGGYKVNPLEVEQVIMQISGVKDVVVKARKSSVTGEIVVADIIKDEQTEKKALRKSIRQYTTKQLQPWKIPRIITFVDRIEVTRTGKKVRK